ncbi:MAG: hypothetical protein QXT68_08155 [Halobacteria archaeon]
MPEERPPSVEEAIRRLAEVEEEINAQSRFETLARRAESLEKRVKELDAALASVLRRDEGEALFRTFEAGLKEHFDRKAAALEESAREHVRRLSDIDAEIIEKMRRMERFFARVGDLEAEAKKLGASLAIAVTREELAKEKAGIEERLMKAEIPREAFDDLWNQLKSLRALVETLPRRAEMVEFRKSLRGEELSDLRKEWEAAAQAQRKALEESVRMLSQVDSEIIAKMKRLERSLERLSDQLMSARKISAVEQSRDPGPRAAPG